ncbi:glycerophosphodiester phosphodiesterase family protein [Colwellia sp. RE-S-Sl-9]
MLHKRKRWLYTALISIFTVQGLLPVMASMTNEADTIAKRYYTTLKNDPKMLPAPQSGPGFTEWAVQPENGQCNYGPGNAQFDEDKIIEFINQDKSTWDKRFDDSQSIEAHNEKWLLSAHRGVHGKIYENAHAVPENSIQAIIEAGVRNFELIELDVHMDLNNQLVLMHDYTIGRTSYISTIYNWDPLIDPPVIKNANNTYTGGVFTVNDIGGGGLGHNSSDLYTYYPSKELPPYTSTTVSRSTMSNFNPALIDTSISYRLRGFSRDTHAFSVSNSRTAYITNISTALNFIGQHYPGMVVVLDLRHQDEVAAAIKAIDSIYNCKGVAAKHWVVLKPFANVYPDGLTGNGNTLASHISAWANYYWIPVLSSRLLYGVTPGSATVYPGGLPGPDTNTINGYPALTDQVNNQNYLQNWLSNTTSHTSKPIPAVIGFEVADTQGLPTYAYNINNGLGVTSWRPPDVRQISENFSVYTNPYCYPSTGHCDYSASYLFNIKSLIDLKGNSHFALANQYGVQEIAKCLDGASLDNSAVIGYNFKDDGLGKYAVTVSNYGCLADKFKSVQILTIDDADRVMFALREETRDAILNNSLTNSIALQRKLMPLLKLQPNPPTIVLAN